MSRSDLNGQIAQLHSFDKASGRWAVTTVHPSAENLKIKASNLTLQIKEHSVSDLSDELWHACREGDSTKLSELLARVPPMGWGNACRSGTRMSTMDVAARNGHVECLRLLLQEHQKPNLKKTDEFGQAVMHLAAEGGCAEICSMLLAAGSDPNTPDGQGQTPLHVAAEEGHTEFAKVLLQNGAEASASVLYRGATRYQWAVQGGHGDCARVLKGLSKSRKDLPAEHNPYTHTEVAYGNR